MGRRGYLSALGASGALAAAGLLALLLASLYVTFNGWPGLRDPVAVTQTVRMSEPDKPAPKPRGVQLPTPEPSGLSKPEGRRSSRPATVAVRRPAADQDGKGTHGSPPAPARSEPPAEVPAASLPAPAAEPPAASPPTPAAEPLALDAPALSPVSEAVERTTERLPAVVEQVQDVTSGDTLVGVIPP